MSIEGLSAWDEVDEFLTSTPSPQQILAFHPSELMQLRLQHLIEAAHSGLLTADERVELDEHLALETFMSRLKIKALAKTKVGQ